ncbi:MAG: hypothetical protein Q4E88_03885 [Coriobacteriia bacterium]|nr:hypothetical protein [Coriobacteriia bacterium]
MIVFIVAIIGIFAAVFAYMTISHSLDLTATSIDNSVGNLEGYSVFVFEGNNTTRQKNKSNVDRILDRASNLLNLNQEEEKKNDKDTVAANVTNVNQVFKDKDCKVYNFKVGDYDAYSRGQIYERGNQKVGVLSINEATLQEALASKYAQLKVENPGITEEMLHKTSVKNPTIQMKNIQNYITNLRVNNKADILIIVAPRQEVLEVVDKIDCLIAKSVKEDIPDEGKSINDVYIMRVPEAGKIGAILSSPAKMMQGSVFSKVAK